MSDIAPMLGVMATPAPAPQYDLVGPLLQGIIDTPRIWIGVIAENPGPWVLPGVMLAGVLVLSLMPTTRRRRRVNRR